METIRKFRKESEEYAAALALRFEELRKPLGLQFTEEELKKDENDIHFGLFVGDKIVACLTLTDSGDKRMKMRQVATDSGFQGKGYGRKLADEAERFAKAEGFKTMYCNARKVAVPFYAKLGYKIVSDEFIEVGIPHFTMEKKL